MISKDFAKSFAEKMKETANKEQEYKDKILKILVEIANTLNDQSEQIDFLSESLADIQQYIQAFDHHTDAGDIFNRLVVKNIVIGEE